MLLCKLVGENVEGINGLPYSTAPSTCKSKNVTYLLSVRWKNFHGCTIMDYYMYTAWYVGAKTSLLAYMEP